MQSVSLLSRYRVADNPQKTERRVELVFLAVLLLLVLWIALGFMGYAASGAPDPVAPASDSLQVKRLTLEEPLTPESSAAMLARPLFWQERRPFEAAPVVTTKPTTQKKVAKLDGVQLHGVFGASDSLGIIATVDGKLGRITPGDTVKGWQLQSFKDGVASFTNSGRTQEIVLAVTTPSVRVIKTSPAPAQEEQEAPRAQQGGGLSFGGSTARPKRQ